jgi:hypothetical protein
MNSPKANVYLFTAFAACLAATPAAFSQAAPVAQPAGTISALSSDGKSLTMKTDAGPSLIVELQETTSFLKVPLGEKSLAKAEKIDLKAVSLGDRAIAQGTMAAGNTSIKARRIIIMSKDDVAKKQEADRAEWTKRGLSGTVAEVDAAKMTFTVKTGSATAAKLTTVALNDNARMRRYSHDSIKFNDAIGSKFDDIKIGDQVRALGIKAEDGTSYKAEEVISGTFRNIAAQVVSVDVASNTMVVKDLDAKKNITVKVTPDASFKKLPERFAQMMAMRLSGGARGGAGGARGGAPGATPAAAGGQRGGGPGGPGGMGGGTMDTSAMLEKLPQVQLSEINKGDALMISSMAGTDAGSIVAITLIAGVEPIFTAAPQGNRQQMMGNWSLETNPGGQ